MSKRHSRLLLLGAFLVFGRVPAAENTCVTAACHATIVAKKDVHPPTDSCDSCHEAMETPHPQKGKTTFKLTQPASELCQACHDDKTTFPVTHGPASAGDCTSCHDPHASDEKPLLRGKSDDLCFGCHVDVKESLGKAHVHSAIDSGCTTCHNPHGSAHAKLLPDEGAATCIACHDAIGEKVDKASVPHPPVKSEKACASCHSPHASDNEKLLLSPEKETCLSCHKTIVTPAMTVVHPPAAQGECAACHDPHGGSNRELLVASFPSTPYVPYTDDAFALCFTCHKADIAKYPDTSFATGFRDGERNLHFLHVNNPTKGRSCALCHEMHGGTQPKLMAAGVAFGTWRLPVKFVKTETGGSCAPGCHQPKSYDRKTAVKKP